MALRFKLDENVPGEVAALLRDAGHDASSALEEGLGGLPDERMLQACKEEARVLVTLDMGCGDIRAYPPPSHGGIWVLRPNLQSVQALMQLVSAALGAASGEPLSQRLWIVEPGRVRIRE